MTREEFIKQRCEIDKITLEEFEEQYRVVDCNCGKPYCKGYRCLDLDDLLKENQELKQKYLNAVADYETTMAEKEQLNNCQEDIRQLKEQLEEYREQVNKGLYNTCLPYTTGYNKAIEDKEIQEKRFIKYLEDEIKRLPRVPTPFYIDEKDIPQTANSIAQVVCIKVLNKYIKIIGVSDENN